MRLEALLLALELAAEGKRVDLRRMRAKTLLQPATFCARTRSRRTAQSMTPEQRSERTRKAWRGRTPEERREIGQKISESKRVGGRRLRPAP